MKYKIRYEMRVLREVVLEADNETDARDAVHDGKAGGEVDIEDVELPDIVACEVVQ